jgi:hypothetical protein
MGAQSHAPHSAAHWSAARGLALSIVVNGALPVVAYWYLTGHGWTSTSALIGTSTFPIIASLVSLARSRTVDGLSLLSIVFIALGRSAVYCLAATVSSLSRSPY